MTKPLTRRFGELLLEVTFDEFWSGLDVDTEEFGIPFPIEAGTVPYSFVSCVARMPNGAVVGVTTGRFQRGVWVPRGTLVKRSWRRSGLGHRLWRHLFEVCTPYAVDVITVTEAGRRLVTRLREERPDMEWYVRDWLPVNTTLTMEES